MEKEANEKKSSKSCLGCFGFLIIVALILFISNPGKIDFGEYVEDEIELELITIVNKDGGWLNLLFFGEIDKAITVVDILASTRVDNYYLFSVFTVKHNGKKTKILGIADHFILI